MLLGKHIDKQIFCLLTNCCVYTKMSVMVRCFVLLHYETHWEDFIPEPYLSMVFLAAAVGFAIYLVVAAIRKKQAERRARKKPSFETDEEFVATLVEAKLKRDEERYVGNNSTAIPKLKPQKYDDKSIWEQDSN